MLVVAVAHLREQLMKPESITYISNAAIAVGFVLLLVGVGMMGQHSAAVPTVLFWLGVLLLVSGCFVRAWRF